MHPPDAALRSDAFPSSAAEPLVPILRLDQGIGDPDALATWHQALSNALAPDVPHDLLALWLYPHAGGVVLLGPEALAQDELAIPHPSPQLQPNQLSILEEIVQDAGYVSTASLPIRFGRRDVGLLLVGSLQPGRYGGIDLMVLRLAAQRLAPSLGRLARQWSAGEGAPGHGAERVASLLEGVAQATAAGGGPQGFASALSRALEPLIPHDRLELLLAGPGGGRYYRLGEHLGGALWADSSLVLESSSLDLDSLAEPNGRVLLGDAGRDARWPRGYFTVADPAGADLRAVAGARATGPTRLTTFLLLGSVGPDLYEEADAELLARVAALIAPHVALLADQAAREREPKALPATAPSALLQVGEILALEPDSAEAIRRVAEVASRCLPFDELNFALRLSEGDRAVLLDPGERRPLPDLASVPVAGTALGQVLQGELSHWLELARGEARVIVPLRVAGRVHGAMMLTAGPPAALNHAHLEAAQRLADVVAPHLELLRRAAMLPQPFRPGWKREPKR
jgi:hypothetical protein